MILDPKHRGKVKVIWATLSLLVILGMVLFSIPGLFY